MKRDAALGWDICHAMYAIGSKVKFEVVVRAARQEYESQYTAHAFDPATHAWKRILYRKGPGTVTATQGPSVNFSADLARIVALVEKMYA